MAAFAVLSGGDPLGAPFRERWFLSRMGNRTRVGENSVTAKSWMTVTNAGQTLADKIFAAQQAGEG